MKKRFNNFLLIATLATFGMVSCSDDKVNTNDLEDKNPGNSADETAYLSFSFVGEDMQTRAAGDTIASTADEMVLKTAYIYIYEENKATGKCVFEKRVVLGDADFIHSGSKWTLKDDVKIAVKPGDKKIYAGLNIPATFNNKFAETFNTFTMENESQLRSSGFAMFAKAPKTTTAKHNSAGKVSFDVERILAKVALYSDELSYTITGEGKYTDFKFEIFNRNKKFYLFQRKEGGVVLDPNYGDLDWDSGVFDNDFFADATQENITTRLVKYPTNTDFSRTDNVKYILENTTEMPKTGFEGDKLRKTSSYACLKVNYTPDSVYSIADGKDVAGVYGKTFYLAKYEGGEQVFVYAKDSTEAWQYADSVAQNGVIKRTVGEIKEYKNANSYYNIFVGKSLDYDVIRNHFYIINITDIKGLGGHTPGVPDKEEVIEPNVNIEVTINVMDWYINKQNVSIDN